MSPQQPINDDDQKDVSPGADNNIEDTGDAIETSLVTQNGVYFRDKGMTEIVYGSKKMKKIVDFLIGFIAPAILIILISISPSILYDYLSHHLGMGQSVMNSIVMSVITLLVLLFIIGVIVLEKIGIKRKYIQAGLQSFFVLLFVVPTVYFIGLICGSTTFVPSSGDGVLAGLVYAANVGGSPAVLFFGLPLSYVLILMVLRRTRAKVSGI